MQTPIDYPIELHHLLLFKKIPPLHSIALVVLRKVKTNGCPFHSAQQKRKVGVHTSEVDQRVSELLSVTTDVCASDNYDKCDASTTTPHLSEYHDTKLRSILDNRILQCKIRCREYDHHILVQWYVYTHSDFPSRLSRRTAIDLHLSLHCCVAEECSDTRINVNI